MDPFAVLGLRSDAEPEVVEAAIRALRLKHHPDKGGDPDRFRKISEAVRCLRSGEPLAQDPQRNEALRSHLRAFGEMFRVRKK